MNFSGDIFKFYSEIQANVAFEKMKNFAEGIGYQVEYDHYADADTLFCFKNKKMYGHHLRQGYNTDFDGQGCFNIEVKKIKLNADLIKNLAALQYFNVNKNADACFFYILAIPKINDGNPFSTQVLNAICKILMHKTTS